MYEYGREGFILSPAAGVISCDSGFWTLGFLIGGILKKTALKNHPQQHFHKTKTVMK